MGCLRRLLLALSCARCNSYVITLTHPVEPLSTYTKTYSVYVSAGDKLAVTNTNGTLESTAGCDVVHNHASTMTKALCSTEEFALFINRPYIAKNANTIPQILEAKNEIKNNGDVVSSTEITFPTSGWYTCVSILYMLTTSAVMCERGTIGTSEVTISGLSPNAPVPPPPKRNKVVLGQQVVFFRDLIL